MVASSAHIFISYSSVDRLFVEDLADLLSGAYEVWFDQRLVGGDPWWTEILERIAQCSQFIYLISRDSLESEWCQKELVEAQKLGKHVIPVLVRARTEIPEESKRLQLVDMSDGITAKNLSKLYAALIKADSNRSNPDIDEKKVAADRKLLEQLWLLINTQNIGRLDAQTQLHYIDADFYDGKIMAYLRLRDSYENPQNVFFNPVLEASFKAFDEALFEYDVQKGYRAFSFELVGERRVYLSDYKACRKAYASQEITNYKLREYETAVGLVLAAREKLNELVNVIKSIFPDFDFSDHSD